MLEELGDDLEGGPEEGVVLTGDFEEVTGWTLVVASVDTAVFMVTVAMMGCVEVDVILGAIGVFDIADTE